MKKQKLRKFIKQNKKRNIIVRALWQAINILFFKTPIPFDSGFKINLLKLFGAKMGKSIVIKPNVYIKSPWNLLIGNDTWIGEGVWIDNVGKITIGKNVCISQGVYLISGGHDYAKESFDLITRPIIIEDGVWLCAFSKIAPGVVCQSHSVLSIGSVAINNLLPYTIYRGNPAIKYKKRIIK